MLSEEGGEKGGRVRSKWALRTVRDGQIRLDGVDWKPDERWMSYDGRLDGRRLLFARYPSFEEGRDWEPFIALWGTEGAYRCERCRGENCADPDHWPGPHCIDGKFVWDWWRPAS